jgi:hypothetical protein
VPTLSYTPAQSAVTDEFGGGISVHNKGVAEPSADGNNQAGKENPYAAPATPTSSTTVQVAAAEQPAPTPPPVAPQQPKGSIIATSTYTSAGVVHEVVIEEVPVYVTVEAPAPAQKRHAHHFHQRRDREHGVLGRRHFH